MNRSDPTTLADARDQVHRAVQWVTRAARANLSSRSDDSHSNLGWDERHGALSSHALSAAEGGSLQIGLVLSDLRLIVLQGHEERAALDLGSRPDEEAGRWLDQQLASAGLAAASPVELPYALPEQAAALVAYDDGAHDQALDALAAWFGLAHEGLSKVAEELDGQASPVRCWPHHFDIATLVSLEEGDPETARSVGIGMSPGDESIAEPYFYVNPWPALDAEGLPPLPEPGHWHVEGWVGAVAPATDILALSDPRGQLVPYLARAYAIGRGALGL